MSDVLILHLESSGKNCSVALSKNGKLVDCKEEYDYNYIHSEKLTVFVQDILEVNKIELADLNAISVSIGPGSYTGLRIGLSTAKAMCFALDIPLIPINSLEILLYSEKNKLLNKIAVVDARRMEVYALGQNVNGEENIKMGAYILNEESFSQFEPFIIIGDSHEKLKQLWVHRNSISYSKIERLSASFQSTLAFNFYMNRNRLDLQEVNPIYIKSFLQKPSTG